MHWGWVHQQGSHGLQAPQTTPLLLLRRQSPRMLSGDGNWQHWARSNSRRDHWITTKENPRLWKRLQIGDKIPWVWRRPEATNWRVYRVQIGGRKGQEWEGLLPNPFSTGQSACSQSQGRHFVLLHKFQHFCSPSLWGEESKRSWWK